MLPAYGQLGQKCRCPQNFPRKTTQIGVDISANVTINIVRMTFTLRPPNIPKGKHTKHEQSQSIYRQGWPYSCKKSIRILASRLHVAKGNRRHNLFRVRQL